jgi:serine-type D-Ala-D-Ala carboxypeptidase (penicillin-binding protein 5/6)
MEMERRSGVARFPASLALLLAILLVTARFTGTVVAGALRSGPPPTAVPPNGSPSPFPTSLETPRPSAKPPKLSSPSVVMEDLDTGQVLFAMGARIRRPVASITKVMTALVVLEEARPSEVVTVSAEAAAQFGSVLGLEAGERITVRDLLYALLLQSSNDAAAALAEHVGGSVDAFVAMMNRKADDLGLTATSFRDPAGLNDAGLSTARDVAAITRAAHARPLFARIVATKFRDIPAPSGPDRHVQNRNILLWLYPGAIGTKTGFTTAAGHCLVAAADQIGMRLLVVALGAPGPDSEDVFADAASLLNYGFAAFARVTFVHAGEVVGTVQVEGRPVGVRVTAGLVLLIKRDLVPTTEYRIHPHPALVLPVLAGQEMGTLAVLVDGRSIGVLDVVAAGAVSVPSPPAPSPVPGRQGDPLAEPLRLLAALVRVMLAPFL